MPKSAARQFLVKVSGVDGFFATKTGGQPSSTSTKAWDGGSLVPDILTSTPEYSDMTVARPFDPARDAPVLARLRPRVGSSQHTIEVTATDASLSPLAAKVSYTGTLVGCNDPDVDAASTDAARFELIFSVRSAK